MRSDLSYGRTMERQLSGVNHNRIESHRCWVDGMLSQWANCPSRFQTVPAGQERRGPLSGRGRDSAATMSGDTLDNLSRQLDEDDDRWSAARCVWGRTHHDSRPEHG